MFLFLCSESRICGADAVADSCSDRFLEGTAHRSAGLCSGRALAVNSCKVPFAMQMQSYVCIFSSGNWEAPNLIGNWLV